MVILLWGLPTALPATNATPAPKPNIVFFLVDDMGWQETAVPFHSERTALNRRYRTPHMERLAAQGMKFTQAYASAVCSPTRISALTGMTAARHRVTNWTLRKDRLPDNPSKVIKPPDWVEKAVADKQPFYLYLAHYAIHAPREKDDRFYQARRTSRRSRPEGGGLGVEAFSG